MPTVLRTGPYRLHFYSADRGEPAHIHVARDDLEAKFWLEPVCLSRNFGFSATELNQIRKLLVENYSALRQAWEKHHGHK